MSMVASALLFLVDTLCSFYSNCLLLRLLLEGTGLHYTNPLAQFITRITEPVLRPVRRALPRMQQVDVALCSILLVLTWTKLLILFSLQMGHLPALAGWLLWAVPDLIKQVIYIYFFALLAQVVLSWIMPARHHPLLDALYYLNEPWLRKIRRWLPLIAGFDLSPMVLLVLLQLLIMLCVNPLQGMVVRLL